MYGKNNSGVGYGEKAKKFEQEKNRILVELDELKLRSQNKIESLDKESWIAKSTIDKVNNYLDKGDQILFFLNRRGYSPFVICKKCNYKFQCPNCTINLNYHKRLNKLLCHFL